MSVLLQFGQPVIKRAEGVAGPLRRNVAVGQLAETLQRAARVGVLPLQFGNRGVQLLARRRRSGRSLQFSDTRENRRLLVRHVRHQLGREALEHGPDFNQPGLVRAMHGGDFSRHKIEPGQLLAQVAVVRRLDVVAKLRHAHRVGIYRRVTGRRAVQRLQHRQHRGGVQALGRADLGQRLLPATAVVDAELFKDARPDRGGAHEFTDGGFQVGCVHLR